MGDRGWDVQVLGTDINDESLKAARAAEYGEWSFRGVPPVLRDRWFDALPARKNEEPRWRPLSRVRDCVEVDYLNLRDPIYPSIFTRTTELDLVLCRNVFLYFFPEGARTCLQRFARCVTEGGYVLCGPADLFHVSSADVPDLLSDKTAPNRLRRGSAGASRPAPLPAAVPTAPPAPRRTPAPAASPSRPRDPGPKRPMPSMSGTPTPVSPVVDPLVRLLASGDWAAAEAQAKAALEKEPLSVELSRALALALTAADEARSLSAWKRVLYLDPADPGAHFGLGMALLHQGRRPDARAHFRAVVKLLGNRDDAEVIPGPDALPVGWLRAACRSLSAEPKGGG